MIRRNTPGEVINFGDAKRMADEKKAATELKLQQEAVEQVKNHLKNFFIVAIAMLTSQIMEIEELRIKREEILHNPLFVEDRYANRKVVTMVRGAKKPIPSKEEAELYDKYQKIDSRESVIPRSLLADFRDWRSELVALQNKYSPYRELVRKEFEKISQLIIILDKPTEPAFKTVEQADATIAAMIEEMEAVRSQ